MHVERDLLAYLDGELSPQERARLEEHLAQCEQCQAELACLKALRAGLETTFHAALDPVRMPTAADERVRARLRAGAQRQSGQWSFLLRLSPVLHVALALLILFFGAATYRAATLPQRADQQETIVLGQEKLAPGSRAALRVLVRSTADGDPIPGADVTVRLNQPDGKALTLFQGTTDAYGTANVEFTVPADVEGQARVTVETRSEAGKDLVERPIQIAREYKLFVSSDKPLYQPGQTVHIRALALGAADLKPAAGREIEFIIADPDGDKLLRRTVAASDFGIAALDFPLSPYAAHGRYTIQAVLGDTVSERTVTVQPYVLPKFRVSVETDRTFYRPGETVSGRVRAEYFFGKPVAGGKVTLRGYTYEVERVQKVEIQGTTDDEGVFEFEFDLPTFFVGGAPEEGRAEFALEVEVVDGADHREATSRMLPVAEQPLQIEVIPESGVLKPGVENILFILTSYPDGRPAEADLSIRVDGRVYGLPTGPYGLAEFRYIPSGPAQLEIEARTARGDQAWRTVYLDADQTSETLLLRAERAAYQVGETMRLEALTTDRTGTVYLDIVREGQTVSTRAAPVEEGRARFAVDLDETMFGTLELHAYRVLPDGTLVRDTRVVVVDLPRQVDLTVSSDAETYRPGDTATLDFRTVVDGQPVRSALGLAIVDESVFALEEQAPGFARLYFLLERELLEPRYEIHDFQPSVLLDRETEAEIRRQQDTAARAAWAGTDVSDFSLFVRTYTQKLARLAQEQRLAFQAVGNGLAWALVLIPLLLMAVVGWGLASTGVLGRAVGRVSVGFVLFMVFSPVIAIPVGFVMYTLWEALRAGALGLTLAAWLVLWGALAVHGWREREPRAQLVAALLAVYVVLGGILVYLAPRTQLREGWIALVFLGFLMTVLSVAALGVGWILEGRRGAGWRTVALALLLIPVVIYLALAPATASPLTRALGNPVVYAFPAGVLTGCAPKAATPTQAPPREVQEIRATPLPAATPALAPRLEEGKAAPAQRPRLRQYFPETLYWNPEALTDENGRLRLEVPLADSITTWRLTVLASTQRGELGATTYPIRVFQDFFVDLDLPVALTQGDEVSIPVAVYNYLPEAQEVVLELEPAAWYTLLAADNRQTLTVGPNDVEVAYFRIRAERFGRFSLQVTAWGGKMSDAIAREITVVPYGTEQRVSESDWLRESQATIPITIPEEAVPGTARVEVKVYPGPAAQLVDGLEGLLRMPSGCFEQTSSATYPNVLILDYLVRSGQATPEIQMTAERYIATGYQRLLTFEVDGEPGGFSLFGDPPPSLMHTAYGLMEFADMSRVYPVDPALTERIARWLLAQQKGDGSWDPGYGGVHFESWQKLANARLPITAYVAWALVEAGYEDDPGVGQALDYLLAHASEADDPYVLALMVNALSASERTRSQAQFLVERLEQAAIIKDDAAYWTSRVESFTGAQGESASLETTALATYALMRAGGNPDLIGRGLTYLVRAKDTFGTWQTTQATVLALKAFVRSLEQGGAQPVEGTVRVTLNGGATQEVTLRPEAAGVVHTLYFDDVPVGRNTVSLETSGGMRGLLYQVTAVYYVPWKEETTAGPIEIRVSYDRTELEVNETVIQRVQVTLREGRAQWAIVDLGVPPGFAVRTEDLDELIRRTADAPTRVKRYEWTGRQVILYLENLSGTVEFSYRLRARFPVRAWSPAATVYDYYNPTLRAVQPPVQVVVEEGAPPSG
ncbi:MAG: MG2 domain-containing protein [Anaerolineae bacterium]|nr:MG2 domain-containing protein [Anaerolineae bacterium]